MESLNSLFLITAGFGIILILAGFVMRKFPPKKINSLYGYRTPSSMRDQERWGFAQKYSAKEMIKTGFLNILISFFGLIYNPIEPISIILGFTIIILSIIILLFRVETQGKRIKKDYKKR